MLGWSTDLESRAWEIAVCAAWCWVWQGPFTPHSSVCPTLLSLNTQPCPLSVCCAAEPVPLRLSSVIKGSLDRKQFLLSCIWAFFKGWVRECWNVQRCCVCDEMAPLRVHCSALYYFFLEPIIIFNHRAFDCSFWKMPPWKITSMEYQDPNRMRDRLSLMAVPRGMTFDIRCCWSDTDTVQTTRFWTSAFSWLVVDCGILWWPGWWQRATLANRPLCSVSPSNGSLMC